MSCVNFREYKRHAVYTILLICLITLINIIIIKYIKEEQNYQDLLKLSAYQKVMQTLIINNIDVLQKANINNQNDINQQILIFKDYIKNQVFIPKSSLNSRVYNNQLGYINLQELLNDMSDQMFDYLITVNDRQIVGHGIMKANDALIKKYKIMYRIDRLIG